MLLGVQSLKNEIRPPPPPPQQLGTEEYFMEQKSLYFTKNVCLLFCARPSYKSVTFCKIRQMSKEREEDFLNSDNVGHRGEEGSENPSFCRKSFVDSTLLRLNLC